MKRAALWLLLCSLPVGWAPAQGEPDVVYLRDGTARRGSILQESETGYVLSATGRSENIPKNRVRFAIYGSEERVAERLGIAELKARYAPEAAPADVEVLTAPDFAAALKAAIAGAKRSVYLTTYTLGAEETGAAREIFDLLLQKGREKKSVVLLAPVGLRTHAAVRARSLNLGKELEDQGLSIRFLETDKLQHKKLVIIDNQVVFIGSSNLTSAGLSENQEMNLVVRDPAFVAAARKDFDSLRRRSKRWLDLKR